MTAEMVNGVSGVLPGVRVVSSASMDRTQLTEQDMLDRLAERYGRTYPNGAHRTLRYVGARHVRFGPLWPSCIADFLALLQRPKVTDADIKAAEELVPECLFRMFQPHEVAAGMAFPRDYIWQPDPNKKVSNRDLVRAAGNAVCPPCARDLMAVVVETFGGAA